MNRIANRLWFRVREVGWELRATARDRLLPRLATAARFLRPRDKPTSDMIPLIDAVEVAWLDMAAQLKPRGFPVLYRMGGEETFQVFGFELFGLDDAVPLYAVRPPLKRPSIILGAYDRYDLYADGTGVNPDDPEDVLVDIQVSRKDVSQWIKNRREE